MSPRYQSKKTLSSLSRKITLPALAACAASCLAVSAHAQSPAGTNTVDPEAMKKLLQRVDELEVKAKRVDELEAQIKGLSSAAPAPEVTSIREAYPKIQFNVLGDVDFHVSNARGDKNTFLLGDIDPVITAKLSEKAGVLGDFVIGSDSEGGGFAFEVERLLLQYSFNDYFNVEAGRFHTAIGYYNNTYHNGTYFQTTTERPSIYHFEDSDGGILPVHSDGISVNGEIPSGGLRLRYVAEIANGRDYSTDDSRFSVADDNDFKALNFALSARPEWVPGLQIGASLYHDTVTATGLPRIDQLITSGYVVYKTPLFESLNEVVLMRNAPKGDSAHWTTAAYTQISRKFGKYRPYLRLEYRNSPDNDPLLASLNENFWVWGPTIGVRYDFTPMMALKVEYQHTEQRQATEVDELTFQWTFRY